MRSGLHFLQFSGLPTSPPKCCEEGGRRRSKCDWALHAGNLSQLKDNLSFWKNLELISWIADAKARGVEEAGELVQHRLGHVRLQQGCRPAWESSRREMERKQSSFLMLTLSHINLGSTGPLNCVWSLCFEIMCCHVLVWSTSLFSTCNIWIYTSLPFRKIFVNKKGKTQMLTSCKITFSGSWLLIILWNADQYSSIQIKTFICMDEYEHCIQLNISKVSSLDTASWKCGSLSSSQVTVSSFLKYLQIIIISTSLWSF